MINQKYGKVAKRNSGLVFDNLPKTTEISLISKYLRSFFCLFKKIEEMTFWS